MTGLAGLVEHALAVLVADGDRDGSSRTATRLILAGARAFWAKVTRSVFQGMMSIFSPLSSRVIA